MNAIEMTTAERTDLAEFLATLTLEQWQAPSLCERWRVRAVVAHVMSFDGVNLLGMLRRAIRGRIVHINQVGVDELASLSTEQLLAGCVLIFGHRGWLQPLGAGSPCSMSPSIIKTYAARSVCHARSRLNGCAASWTTAYAAPSSRGGTSPAAYA
jgi:Mycothiol maleylpyruvate isomerase N-terminal domain